LFLFLFHPNLAFLPQTSAVIPVFFSLSQCNNHGVGFLDVVTGVHDERLSLSLSLILLEYFNSELSSDADALG